MPDPYYTIPEHYPRQFATNFNHAIQQMESKFRGMVDPDARWQAKQYVFRDLSKNTWTRNDTRGGVTTARESLASFRSTFKKKVEAEAIEFYEWDEELLAQIVHPKSTEIEAMRAGYERAFDDLTIEAAFEDSFGGPDPHVTSQPFPAAQAVAVNYGTPAAPVAGSDQPMTPWKLFRARKMFEEAEVDLDREEACIALSPAEIEDLTYYVSTAPSDVWAKIVGGWLEQYHNGNRGAKLMGFSPIITNRLLVSASTRNCVAFCRSGFVKSATEEVKVSMDRIPDQRNKLLLQGSAMVGIARRHDEKIIKIPCYHP
jgi:hypothetical protein